MIEILIGLLLTIGNGMTAEEGYEEQMKVVSKANNELSFILFKMLSKEDNDVMSPLSILSAFGILMNGAKEKTFEDMMKFLQFKNFLETFDQDYINKGFEEIANKYKTVESIKLIESDPGEEQLVSRKDAAPQLNMANRVIISDKLKLEPEFENTVKQHFRGDIQKADFKNNAVEETNKLNEWIRNQTNNKIQKIFDELDSNTSALIVNTLYFRGFWNNKFFKESTKKMDFYNNGKEATKTNMMHQEHVYKYGESYQLRAQFLSMDYMNGDISFVVVLPNERNGLTDLKSRINGQNFVTGLDFMKRTNINVYLPKFKAEKSYDLMEDINPKPIALTQRADLTGITSDPLVVDKIQHKVFIEVDEKGTEAAAATAIKFVSRSAMMSKKATLFKADHPFLYFIVDKSNLMILFFGQINKF